MSADEPVPVWVVTSGFSSEGMTVSCASVSEGTARASFVRAQEAETRDAESVDALRRSEGGDPLGHWDQEVLLTRWVDDQRTCVERWAWTPKEAS